MRSGFGDVLARLVRRRETVPILAVSWFLVVVPLLIFHSLAVSFVLLLYLWPVLLAMLLNWFWLGPAMTDFLNEIEYTSPGYIDSIMPLRLSLRKAASPEAERLRRIVTGRLRTTLLIFLSAVPWVGLVIVVNALLRGS